MKMPGFTASLLLSGSSDWYNAAKAADRVAETGKVLAQQSLWEAGGTAPPGATRGPLYSLVACFPENCRQIIKAERFHPAFGFCTDRVLWCEQQCFDPASGKPFTRYRTQDLGWTCS